MTNRIIIKIVKTLMLIFIVLILLVLLIFNISRLFNKDNYAKLFGYSVFEVTSDSMYPKLSQGDLIIVKKRNKEDYKVGMIVTYQLDSGDKPITHEIVERYDDIIITRGINVQTNDSNDDPFNVECIIGEVVKSYSGYGKIQNFLTNPIGLLIVLVGSLFVFELVKYSKKKLLNDVE